MADREHTIRLSEKLGFLTISGSNNIVYQFKSIYYLFFLTNVVKLPVAWAGVILTAGTVWDAVNDPLIGYWAVNRRFRSGEAVRPFALWHSVPWAITTVLMFTNFHLPDIWATVVATVIFFLFEVFNTTMCIPYNTMAGLATARDDNRRTLNIFRNVGGGVGSAVGAVACLPLLKLFGALNSEGNLIESGASRGFLLVALVMGIVVVAGSLTHYFTTKERVRQRAENTEHIPLKRVASLLIACRSWRYNALYLLCYGVINLLLMTSLTYYATYVLGSTAAATKLQAVYLVAGLASTLLVTPLDRALGRRKTMLLGAFIALLGKIWFLFQPAASGAIYLNALTVGISVTISYVLFNTNRNSIVDIIESRSGRRIDSMVSTVDSLASKLAESGATLLLTMLLGRAGFNADLPAQPPAAIGVINFTLGWAPAIATLVMLAAAFFLPIEREYSEARAILEGKKDECHA